MEHVMVFCSSLKQMKLTNQSRPSTQGSIKVLVSLPQAMLSKQLLPFSLSWIHWWLQLKVGERVFNIYKVFSHLILVTTYGVGIIIKSILQIRKPSLREVKYLVHSFSSVQFCHSVVSDSLRPHGLQHARPPYPSPTPGVYSNLCLWSQRCHPTTSSSVIPFSSCPQSLPASGSFQMSPFFTSGGQSIGVSTSASVLPMNIQDWFPLEWTGWISLQSKGLSRVFPSTTGWKHQLFGAQLSL